MLYLNTQERNIQNKDSNLLMVTIRVFKIQYMQRMELNQVELMFLGLKMKQKMDL